MDDGWRKTDVGWWMTEDGKTGRREDEKTEEHRSPPGGLPNSRHAVSNEMVRRATSVAVAVFLSLLPIGVIGGKPQTVNATPPHPTAEMLVAELLRIRFGTSMQQWRQQPRL